MGNIGDPMTTAPPTVVNGQPRAGFWTGLAKYFSEVSQRLQAPIPPVMELGDPASGGTLNLSGTLNAAVAAITGALSAGSANIAGALAAASVQTNDPDIKHGVAELPLTASAFAWQYVAQAALGTSKMPTLASDGWSSFAASTSYVGEAWLPLKTGDRIKSATLLAHSDATGGNNIVMTCLDTTLLTGATAAIGTNATIVPAGASGTDVSQAVASFVATTVLTGHGVKLRLTFTTSVSPFNKIRGALITFDRP